MNQPNDEEDLLRREREVAERVHAAIEARWQASNRRYMAAIADIEQRRRRANLRFALVLLGSVAVIAAAAALPALLRWSGS